MTLPEIQRAIESLSEDGQVALATWVAERDSAAWDAEIALDFSAGGAGTPLLEKARQDVRAGKSRPLVEGPRKA